LVITVAGSLNVLKMIAFDVDGQMATKMFKKLKIVMI
jgi:hypothetical protein